MSINGQVKWFDPKKGFGFIVGPEEQDVFVHYSQISGDGFRLLRDGEMVEYELIEGDKGFQAREVKRTESTTYSNALKPLPALDTNVAPVSNSYSNKVVAPEVIDGSDAIDEMGEMGDEEQIDDEEEQEDQVEVMQHFDKSA